MSYLRLPLLGGEPGTARVYKNLLDVPFFAVKRDGERWGERNRDRNIVG
jgi:hypothetical protein